MEGFNLFNVGFGELLFILILAGLVMGPQRIRQVARWLGEMTAKLQSISRQFRQQLNAELDVAERQDLKEAMEDIRDLRRQMQDLRRELTGTSRDALSEGNRTLNGSDNVIGAPPTVPRPIDVADDPE